MKYPSTLVLGGLLTAWNCNDKVELDKQKAFLRRRKGTDE
jgi:hypothetical protein